MTCCFPLARVKPNVEYSFKKKADALNVYERTPANYYELVGTVANQEAWESVYAPLKEQGREFLLVRGTIEDSTYTEVES